MVARRLVPHRKTIADFRKDNAVPFVRSAFGSSNSVARSGSDFGRFPDKALICHALKQNTGNVRNDEKKWRFSTLRGGMGWSHPPIERPRQGGEDCLIPISDRFESSQTPRRAI
jgi:hypothetical protein